MELLTNRYSQVAPTAILPNGVSLSVPVYVSLTTEQSKTILNAVREIIREQRLEMGHNPIRESDYGVTVETAIQAPQTPIEIELGCDESNLRKARIEEKLSRNQAEYDKMVKRRKWEHIGHHQSQEKCISTRTHDTMPNLSANPEVNGHFCDASIDGGKVNQADGDSYKANTSLRELNANQEAAPKSHVWKPETESPTACLKVN